MHSEAYTGMTSEGVFTGMPHPLFVSGIPAVDDAPEFTLKKVDDATICKVQQRYNATTPPTRGLTGSFLRVSGSI